LSFHIFLGASICGGIDHEFDFLEQNSFDYEDVKKKVEQVVEQTLQTSQYQAKKVNDWSSSIMESCIKNLQQAGKPFKYVGTIII
jgi:dynein light chain Tctex-type 1